MGTYNELARVVRLPECAVAFGRACRIVGGSAAVLARGLCIVAAQQARSRDGDGLGLRGLPAALSRRRLGDLRRGPVAAGQAVDRRLSRRGLAAAALDGVLLLALHVVGSEGRGSGGHHCWGKRWPSLRCRERDGEGWLLLMEDKESDECCEKMLDTVADEAKEKGRSEVRRRLL